MRKVWTASQRREVYNRFGGHCAYCGTPIPFDEMQIDHMLSLHNHGSDTMDNLLPACRDCNYYKGGCNPDGFRKRLKRAFRREKRCDFVQRLEDKYEGWSGKFWYERQSNGDDND